MFNELIDNIQTALFRMRLDAAAADMRGLSLSTREEYQAEVTSRLNAILALGNTVTPLRPVVAEGPASVGDVTENLSILNRDAQAIVMSLMALEQNAADLYNLAASSQNALRQQIREMVFSATSRRYVEAFIHSKRIDIAQATIDYNAGVAASKGVLETEVTPDAITFGPKSSGQAQGEVSSLLDGKPETVLAWIPTADSGPLALELVLTFSAVQIINRIRIQLDDYSGLDLVELTSSPDGSLRENILTDLRTDQTRLDGASSKFSGDVILDFDPRHVKNLRLLLTDRTGDRRIAIRNIRFYQRQYENQGIVQSTKLTAPQGSCWFSTVEHSAKGLTSITHQVSSDGVHFSVVTPESQLSIDGPFWYRAILQRDDKAFQKQDDELKLTGADPKLTNNFSLTSSKTTDLGGGVMQRRIDVSAITGALQLKESPLPGTLSVLVGASVAGPATYTFDPETDTISFLSPQSAASIRYQSSVLSAASLKARQRYYSPYLHQVRFERI